MIILGYFSQCLHKIICCWYSLEALCRGASYEYTQRVFYEEIRKISQN